MNPENHKVLYVGNLSYDINKEDLAYNLWLLFKDYLGINIKQKHVSVYDTQYTRYAFVNVYNESNAAYALVQLSTWESRCELQFNFSLLCERSKPLKVGLKRENPAKSGKKKKKKKQGKNSATETEFSSDDSEEVQDSYGRVSPAQVRPTYYTAKNPVTTTHRVYHEGQKLGNETRNVEFKTGGEGYLDNNLKHDVPKYLCGFLNSGVKGTLYIGVKDDGSVVGTECDQEREDKVRQWIDKAVTSIEPAVFTDMYTVTFRDMYTKPGVPKENYKVIEISLVNVVEERETLYTTKKGAFIRRDGSVQCLSPADIQEWTKQKHSHEKRRLQSENKTLHEKVRQQEEQLQENVMKIKEQEYSELEVDELREKVRRQDEELQENRKTLNDLEKKLQKKSKVCVVQ